MRFTLLLVVCALGLPCCAQTEPPKLRLDGNATPIRYAAELALDPAKPAFTGVINIDVRLAKPSGLVWLNATDIEAQKAEWQAGGKTLPLRVVAGGKDFLGLASDSALSGSGRLHIEYTGKVEQQAAHGIFHREDHGSHYLYTQFEATDARRAFPCFDEPSYKVPWKLTLRVPADQRVFSNYPEAAAKDNGDGTRTVQFGESAPMPTYLLALAVGPLETVDGGTAGRNKVPLRVIVPKGRTGDAEWTVKVTPRIVNALEEYFGIPYPYPKLDQIAIPIQQFGAMENVGLITYAENLLLRAGPTDTPQRMRSSADVMIHEIGHHWFGNLVTTAWWDDIWLNEAFASWVNQKFTAQLFPEWKTELGRVGSKTQVMRLDGLSTARRIRQPISSRDDIMQAFDGITYTKGASVIHMWEHFLGEDAFRRGVQDFLKRHAWKAATANDFLASLSRAYGKDIAPAFSTFLERAGVPLLNVQLDCSAANPKLSVTQERFVPLGTAGSRDSYWQVPLCVTYGAEGATEKECHLIGDPRQELTLARARSCPAWLNADANAAGYYRVRYDPKLLDKLLDPAVPLTPLERVNLVRNTQSLLLAGLVDANDALKLAQRAAASPEPELTTAAAEMIGSVARAVPVELSDQYARFVRETFLPAARKLGWQQRPDEASTVQRARAEALVYAGVWGRDPEVRTEAVEKLKAWLAKPGPGDPLVGVAGTIAMAQPDRELFRATMRAAENAKDRQTMSTALAIVGSVRDAGLAKEALSWMTSGKVPTEQSRMLLFQLRSAPGQAPVVWDYMTANYDTLVTKLPAFARNRAAEFVSVGQGFCSTEDRAKVEAFFGPKLAGQAEGARTLAQTLESIGQCVAVRAAQQPGLRAFLKAY